MSDPSPSTDPAARFFDAVARGDTALVRSLLDDEPALLAALSAGGVRAPLIALYHGHNGLADELAGRSAPLDVHEASAFDDNGRLRAVLQADPESVHSWSVDGWQPLHLAAYFGRTEAVRQLLDDDAPVTVYSRNSSSTTALHSAATGRHSETVWLLIGSGAEVDARQRGGWTALHVAARNDDDACVRALLAAGADPLVQTDDGDDARTLAGDEVRALVG